MANQPKKKLTKKEREARNVKIYNVPRGKGHEKVINRLIRKRQIFNPDRDDRNVDIDNVPKTERHRKYINKAKASRFFKENFNYHNTVMRAIWCSVALLIVLIPSITLSVYVLSPGSTITPVYNSGIAFSMLKEQTAGIFAIQSVLCVVLVALCLFCCKWYTILPASLATFGAFYNLIDRAIPKQGHFNCVLDYIGMGSSVCNVPDIMVLTGIGGLVVSTIVEIIVESVQEKKEKQKVSSMFKIEILFENDDLMVVNKPSGIIVHPTAHQEKGTLVDLLKSKIKVSEFEDKTRPGIVQRLDQYTSGLMVVAKTKKAADNLMKQIKDKTLIRKYRAIVHNPFKEGEDEVIIKAPIDRSKSGKLKFVVSDASTAKEAETIVNLVANYSVGALVDCQLKTGRTHQIRVHLSYIHHPIYNDPVYGKSDGFKDYGQFLHSRYIKFVNPANGKVMEFTCEPDQTFKGLVQTLTGQNELPIATN